MRGVIAAAVVVLLVLVVLSTPAVAPPPGDPPAGDKCKVNPSAINGNHPQDLNNDCKFEDFNADGEVNILDTQYLFQYLDHQKVQRYAEAFDFSQVSAPDKVTIFDVAAHWLEFVHRK